jgi:hypothetical protein
MLRWSLFLSLVKLKQIYENNIIEYFIKIIYLSMCKDVVGFDDALIWFFSYR